MARPVLELYRRITRWPAGHWLFARAVCWQAPYFASIAPRIRVLEPGRCEATIRHRRKVTNHIGTVHAIALCNLAELAGGLMTDVTIPRVDALDPQGHAGRVPEEGGRHDARRGDAGHPGGRGGHGLRTAGDGGRDATRRAKPVFRARIAMWLSPKAAR